MSKSTLYSNHYVMILAVTVTVLVGTFITVVLPWTDAQYYEKNDTIMKPYTPLQLAGRDIYQRESCMSCHTQTVRPLKFETDRYVASRSGKDIQGGYSRLEESVYDRPFLWGSRRIGPDLARVGLWYHADGPSVIAMMMANPEDFFPGANMPSYEFLNNAKIDADDLPARMKALGLPYTDAQLNEARGKTEMDALAAYLLTLGAYLAEDSSAAAK